MHALRERKSFQTHILHICCMLSIMKIDCGFNDVHLEAKRFWKAPPRTLIHHQRCCWGVKWRGGDQHVHMWDVYSHGYCSCGILNLWYSRVKIHQYQNHYTCVKFLFYSFLPHKLPFWNKKKNQWNHVEGITHQSATRWLFDDDDAHVTRIINSQFMENYY